MAWLGEHTIAILLQVAFAILGFISGSVGLRGTFAPQGDNKDTVKVSTETALCPEGNSQSNVVVLD